MIPTDKVVSDIADLLMFGCGFAGASFALVMALCRLAEVVGRQRVAHTRALTEQIMADSDKWQGLFHEMKDRYAVLLGRVDKEKMIDRAVDGDWRGRIETRIEALENPPLVLAGARAAGQVVGDFLYPYTGAANESKFPPAAHPIPCGICQSAMVLKCHDNDSSVIWECSAFPECKNSREATRGKFTREGRCWSMPTGSNSTCCGRSVRGSRGQGMGDVIVCQSCARYNPLA